MSIPIRILIVEDSEDDALLLVRELKRGGYTPEHRRVETEMEMAQEMGHQDWDLVITDHNMPNFSSSAALQVVKDSGRDIPIIVVSGSIGEDIAVQAMKSGAHDYIMKDNLTRLVPAIRRELSEAENRHAHRQAEETIRHMAFHDSLTDLVNRREFERRVGRALERARERELTHALLYIDLDQFKIINDTSGHIAGDELLRQLAHMLKKHVRESDTLARLGGDEFGALLESCPMNRAYNIAEALRQAIRNFRFVWDGKPFAVGASIGLVMMNGDTVSATDALSAADMACYAAKDLGRDRIHVFESGDEELVRRRGEMQWVARINDALAENRFTLYSQAIQPLKNGNRIHAEFLLRMLGPESQVVPPGAFIPAAERYNLMPAIDRWVIDNAFAYLSGDSSKKSGKKDVDKYFINLAGPSLNDNNLFDYIKRQMESFRLDPKKIGFEITETAAIGNMRLAVEFIDGIRKLGCSFALDDFGSGLCSFSYLKSIPVDSLKIDGCFVRSMKNNRMDAAIVQAINEVGHVAGLNTIAEFVEDKALIPELKHLGVDYAQGYGIARPMPLKS
ncbi:MAG: EAL domain-containing protein [Acidiferrobacterales bacterium]|jgi:diguanylate cyclase (GGDEF)-like protein|nr:EAL domain-containing protein [Acidiferrobacterales bacterium]